MAVILSPSMNSELALSGDVIVNQTLTGSLFASSDVRLRTSPESVAV